MYGEGRAADRVLIWKAGKERKNPLLFLLPFFRHHGILFRYFPKYRKEELFL